MAKSSKPSSNKRNDAQVAPKPFSGLSVRSIVNMFLERWWIGLIAGAVGAAIFVLAQPKLDPIYKTQVKLLFESKEKKVLNIATVVDTTTSSSLDLQTHLTRLRSDMFLDYLQQSLTPKDLATIQNPYRDAENPNASPPSARSIIKQAVQIRDDKGTTIVLIDAFHRDPEAAALIANIYARKYMEFMYDEAMTGTNSTILWLRNQADDTRTHLENATKEMQAFRERHSMASVGETKSVVAQKLAQLGQQMVNAQIEQTNLRTVLESIDNYEKAGKDVMQLREIANSGAVSGLRNELQNLRSQRVMLSDRYGEEHPSMKTNALAIEDFEQRLMTNVEMAKNELKTRYAVAVAQEARCRKEYAETETSYQDLERKTDTYKYLEDEYNSQNQALATIQRRLQEAQILQQMESVNMRIIDRAGVPSFPINGTPKQITLQASALGLFLLFALPLGLGFLDSRVKSPADVESGLNQILLGGIKTMKKLSETERPNVFRLGKDDSLSEAYRGIFSEIEIRSVVPFPKRLLVTSSVPSEGKSLTASNLAAVFAAHGRKTLLVDCDFRRPTLRRYFGATAGVGLLPWLRENAHRPDVQVDTHKMGIMNIGPAFDLLPAGDAIKNPTEVIDQIASCDLFNKLSKHYDMIVIDTPPSAIFPDALLLSRFCSEMAYVCRFKTVRKAMIKKTLAKFSDSGISVLGVVLNCVPSSSVLNYGYDGYGSYDSEYYKAYQSEKVTS